MSVYQTTPKNTECNFWHLRGSAVPVLAYRIATLEFALDTWKSALCSHLMLTAARRGTNVILWGTQCSHHTK